MKVFHIRGDNNFSFRFYNNADKHWVMPVKVYLITCCRAALANVYLKESKILRFYFLNKNIIKPHLCLNADMELTILIQI